MSSPGMVIVGAGECGTRAAFALRERGYDGGIALIGEEPHFPYERPPLSKHGKAGPRIIADAARLADAGIDFKPSRRVTEIDRAARGLRTDRGDRLAFDKLLIATGARPRLFPGMEAARTFRTLDDANAVHGEFAVGKHLVVIGGGFIGLELAATARTAGAEVTVIEAGDRPMARIVPEEIAAVAESVHRDNGVSLIFGTGVAAATETSVTLADGRTVEGDRVIAGVGVLPNTELAEAIGLDVANGIVVNERFATSDPNVFAAGDCCNFPYRGQRVRLESWRAAQDQANHAAAAMLGADEPYAAIPWFWSDQFHLTMQIAGLPNPAAETVRRDLDEDAFILFERGPGGALSAASGIGLGNAVARDIRLAEMLIASAAPVEAEALTDRGISLKKLLRGRG